MWATCAAPQGCMNRILAASNHRAGATYFSFGWKKNSSGNLSRLSNHVKGSVSCTDFQMHRKDSWSSRMCCPFFNLDQKVSSRYQGKHITHKFLIIPWRSQPKFTICGLKQAKIRVSFSKTTWHFSKDKHLYSENGVQACEERKEKSNKRASDYSCIKEDG